MLSEIISALPEENRELFVKLVEEYREIKTAYYVQNYELVLAKVGKFVETVFQILESVAFGTISKNPKINVLVDKLEKLPLERFPDSIRVIIPRVAKTAYTFRSKRGAVHINDEVSPNFIDSTFAVASCDWILGEFLRLFLKKEHNEVLEIINGLSKVHVPLVEEISDELVILRPEMTARDQVLTLLFHRHPRFVPKKELTRWVRKSERQINRALSELKKDSYIVETKNGLRLTSRGIEEAEKIQIKYYGTS